MKKMETVGVCDLNAAVAAKDETKFAGHTEICLMAQFATRITGKKVIGSTSSAASLESNPNDYEFHVEGLGELTRLFDMEQYERIRQELPRLVVVDYNYGK